MKANKDNPFAWNDAIQKMNENPLVAKVKPVPLIDLLMPLLENMSDEELEELYKELKNK